MAEHETPISIRYTPTSRLIVNDKDLEDWFAWTEAFIQTKNLDLNESFIMLLNMVAIQAAMHDVEDGQALAIQMAHSMLSHLYQSSLAHIAAGDFANGEPSSETRKDN